MSGVAVLGRNDACPCGSGKKVKRCHSSIAGLSVAMVRATVARDRARKAVQLEIAGHEGYRPPGPGSEELAAGWSIESIREHGCPYLREDGSPMCEHREPGDDLQQVGGCAAGCGC